MLFLIVEFAFLRLSGRKKRSQAIPADESQLDNHAEYESRADDDRDSAESQEEVYDDIWRYLRSNNKIRWSGFSVRLLAPPPPQSSLRSVSKTIIWILTLEFLRHYFYSFQKKQLEFPLNRSYFVAATLTSKSFPSM